MTTASHGLISPANFGSAVLGTQNAGPGSIQPIIIAKLRALWPRKTWAHVAFFLGLSERVAKHRIAGTREFSADEIAHMLRSEHGFEILISIMDGHKPAWWRLCVPLMEVAEVQRMQLAARRRLRKAVEGALDADQEITAAIARAETLSDQEFHSGQIDALRSMAGAPHRAVATPAGAKKTKP